MKEKLLAVYAKVQPVVAKVYSASPFAVGLACGYFGKPIIQLAVSLAAKIIRLIVG